MSSEFWTGRYHTGEQYVAVLYRVGHKHLHLTFRDDTGLRHVTAPRDEERYISPLLLKKDPYPVERIVKKFRAIARMAGATQAAIEELKRAKEVVDT